MLNFDVMKKMIDEGQFSKSFGEVHTVSGPLLISKGPICEIGDMCVVGEKKIPCEVFALKQNRTTETTDVYLMPLVHTKSIKVNDTVYVEKSTIKVPDVNRLLGRVMNGMGEFIDHHPTTHLGVKEIEIDRNPPNALERPMIKEVMPTGIKAIDGMLTIGEGQRIGIFAGSGVGKSTLLGQIAKYAEADVNVFALVGERGREVMTFMERDLGPEGLKRSVCVIATSDETPLMRMKAAQFATSIAEEFREQGKKVLLMMDSVTRFAMAKKEMDLLTGELAPGGKTPSMESSIMRLLERAGRNQKGSITGIYTVLVENDDMNGAIPDMVRGTLDGHIVLTRKLADAGHFPSIDVMASKSRVMDDIVTDEHLEYARLVNNTLAKYKEFEDFFAIGDYKMGRNKEMDFVKHFTPLINQFLQQGRQERVEFHESVEKMKGLFK